MKTLLLALCVWILCGVVSVYCDEALFKDGRERIRYVKDDGVDKIVVEDRKKVGNIQKEVNIIANARDGIKKDQEAKTDNEEVSVENVEISENKEIEHAVLENSTSEGAIKITTDSSKNVEGDKSENKSTGLPVFITDDGKTIQLPHSDVLYNSKTGEILIRNREHHDDLTSATETKGVTNIFHAQKPNNSDIKNLKGFVIDDAHMNKKLLYPVTIPSIEISQSEIVNDTVETTTLLSTETSKNIEIQQSTAENRNEKDNNNDLSIVQNITHAIVEAATEKILPYLVQENTSNSMIAMEPSVQIKPVSENDNIQTTQIDITVPLIKNSKSAMGRSNEKVFDEVFKTQNDKDIPTNDTTADDEPIYKFPITEDNEETSTGVINVKEHIIEKTTRHVEYDPILFETPEAPFIDESEIAKIKNTRLSDNVETAKSSVTVVTRNEGESPKETIAASAKMMPSNERLISVQEQRVLSTTTEKLEPADVLRNYLEDVFLRGPIAILVDVEPKNLIRTRELWSTVESKAGKISIEDVVLFGYDIDGITTMSYHKGSRQNGATEGDTKSLAKALYGITSTSKYYSGPGNPRMALSKAVQLLPYDSGIFVFEADRNSESGAAVPSQVPGKLIKQLITKRIKVYCISSGEAWASGVALTSGGSNIHLPAVPLNTAPSSSLQSSHLTPSQHSLQHHIFYREHPKLSHYREMRALSVYYDTDDDDELVYDEQQTLLLAHNISGRAAVAFQLDSGIRTLTINITELPTNALMRGPQGLEIDLLDESSVSNFSTGSKRLSSDADSYLCVLLVMTKKTVTDELSDEEEEEMIGGESSEYQGDWKLLLESQKPLDVQVTADTSLRVMAKVLQGDLTADSTLKIAVGGSVASIREVEIVDQFGTPMSQISYNRSQGDYAESDTVELESLRALESGTVVKQMNIPEELKPGEKFRLRVEGRNDRDEHFVRISSVLTTPENDITKSNQVELIDSVKNRQYNQSNISDEPKANLEMANGDSGYDHIDGGRAFNGSFNERQQVTVNTASLDVQPLTIIQIGTSSRLYGAPGTILQIHFEVTNRRENAVFYRFGARDDKYFLRSLTPQTQWVNPGQTLNVILTVGITSNAETSIRDTVTFTANGLEPTSLVLYVYVDSERVASDRARPVLRHEFIGDCLGYLSDDNCRQRSWGLDIIARDTDSGVMRISASPGISFYHSNFIAGGRDEARARFTSNCCTHQVIISATDVAGNMASYEVNVSQYFTPASIAAIVLGVILAIILIIAIILLIRLCIKRRRTSRDLPSYSTQRAA